MKKILFTNLLVATLIIINVTFVCAQPSILNFGDGGRYGDSEFADYFVIDEDGDR